MIHVVEKSLDSKVRGYYHISSGSDYAIKELFDATIAALGITLDEPVEVRSRNPDDVYTILLAPSRTNHDFDWKVTTLPKIFIFPY